MEFLASTQGTKGAPQTVRWPCERIILTIGLFEGPTEVQLKISKIIYLEKTSVIEFLACTKGTLRSLQTVRWSWEPIIFSNRHFEGPTGIQLNSY